MKLYPIVVGNPPSIKVGEGGGAEFSKFFQKVGGPDFSHKKRGVGKKGELL